MYDLTHIKCWSYEIFTRGGKNNLGKNCIDGSYLWDSKTRRLFQDESICNVSVSIIYFLQKRKVLFYYYDTNK